MVYSMEKQPNTFDVCIIGAGLSGLSAARHLLKSMPGLSIAVLEARDRVGGKTLSVEPLRKGQVVDVGAAWINDTNQSEVFALSQELGLELVVQNTSGKVIQEDIDGSLSTFDYGEAPEKLVESGGLAEMLRIRQLFEDACQKIDIRSSDYSALADLDAITVADWVELNSCSKTALASVSVWTRAMLGLEPQEISALFFLDYCKSGGGLLQMRKDTQDGGQYLRFVKGTQSLSKGLAQLLGPKRIFLSTRVKQIEHGPKDGQVRCSISTERGTFCCRRVILTLPTSLWQSISFQPPLPESKTTLAKSTFTGYTNKIMLIYESPWWRKNSSLCGLLQSFKGPITVTRDSSVDSQRQFSLTCFLVGDFGRRASQLSQRERFDLVTDHISRVFRPFCSIEQPLTITEHEWWTDPYSQGCPVPCMPPGVMSKHYSEIRRPCSGIHFGGTALSYEWKGYMEGAIRSGNRAADEVVHDLQNETLHDHGGSHARAQKL